METIERHIDNMFRDLPETEEVMRIKDELYLKAVDRHEELVGQGKTENEALGTIIIEMGDRDFVLEEYGYDPDEVYKDYSFNTLEDASQYVAIYRREGSKIGLGVALILLGVGLVSTLDTFGMSIIGVILLLLCVALAVGVFIMSGFKLEDTAHEMNNVEHIFYLSDNDFDEVERQFIAFKRSERYRIPLGVMLCILSVIPILIFSIIDEDILTGRYGVFLFVMMVAVGVYQFILYGMTSSAYEKILNIGEYTIEKRRFEQRMEPLSGIYWISVVLIYLTWSFTTSDWHISWIIWPIAGVLWSLITMVLKFNLDRDSYWD